MTASGIVFAFEGPYEVFVSNSLRDAEAQFEPHFFEPTDYVIIVDDGTIVDAAVETASSF